MRPWTSRGHLQQTGGGILVGGGGCLCLLFICPARQQQQKELRDSLNFHISLVSFLGRQLYITACQARFDSVEFWDKVAIKTSHYACFSFVF